MSLLSVRQFHMLHEAAALHGCLQQYIIIGTDDFPGAKKPDSLMPGLGTEAFLIELMQFCALILKAVAYAH